jgi:hypothetical protein
MEDFPHGIGVVAVDAYHQSAGIRIAGGAQSGQFLFPGTQQCLHTVAGSQDAGLRVVDRVAGLSQRRECCRCHPCHLPVLSVQLARAERGSVPLVTRRWVGHADPGGLVLPFPPIAG